MQRLWPNQRHAVSTDRTMSKKTITNIVEAATIRWSLAMCLTIDIGLCVSLAGVISPQFGFVATYRESLNSISICHQFSSSLLFHFFFRNRMQYGKLCSVESDQKCTTLYRNGGGWNSFAGGNWDERNEASVLWENCKTSKSFYHSRREWSAHVFGVRSAWLQSLQIDCEK